jgi:hypothetical protein
MDDKLDNFGSTDGIQNRRTKVADQMAAQEKTLAH